MEAACGARRNDFVGREAFGQGGCKSRELSDWYVYEYNDVRINRLGLVVARILKKPTPRCSATR